MAYRVKITPRAQQDLTDIFNRIGAASSGSALKWYLALRESLRSLRLNPERSTVTPENRELRHLLYGGRPHVYRVIYRISEKQKVVDILHIRHGARQEFTDVDP